MYDEDLSEYLSEFSSVGSAPTSLSGYGFGQRRHTLELGALGAAATAPTSATVPMTGRPVPKAMLDAQKRWGGSSRLELSPAGKIQQYLQALKAGARITGSYDAQTQSAWNAYVKAFREPHDTIAVGPIERGGLTDYKNIWISSDAMSRLRVRGSEALRKQDVAPTKTTPTTRTTTPTPTKPAAKNMDANTIDVQGILLRLGWPTSKALTDGLYGPTTAGNWAQSAKKRGLDPYIVKKSADGKIVTVREATYLKMKADADALVPPAPTPGPAPEPIGGSLLALPPDQTTTIPVSVLNDTLVRLTKAPAGSTAPWPKLVEMFQSAAKNANLDSRIEQVPPDKAIVLKSTWAYFEKAAGEMPPPQPLPGPEKSEAERAVEVIVKASTERVSVSTIRTAINAAIQAGSLKRDPVGKGAWEGSLRSPLLSLLGVAKEQKAYGYWEMALVKGKLVSKDGDSVKLPPDRAKDIRSLAARYKKAVEEDKSRYLGYTLVTNTADVIDKINALGVTTKRFDKSGGAKELADALETFFQETKTPRPSGDLVRVRTVATQDRTVGAAGTSQVTEVYVKTDALNALATAAVSIKQRADATKAYRDQMVANALRASTAEISITAFQEAMRHMVLSKPTTKTPLLALAEKVKVSGAFDASTRAAYTEVARRLTFEPAMVEFERLARVQLGPNFKSALLTETYKQVWNDFLNQAVSKQSIKTLPAIAVSVTSASDLYRKNVSADQRQAEKTEAQQKVLNEAISKSTAIMSILDVQQGLLHLADRGRIKKTGVKVTGRADKATNGYPNGGLFGLSSMIFKEGYSVPETMWMAYLKMVGILVVSSTQVKASWSEANYIALPPAVADTLSRAATEWIFMHGEPAAGVNLAPLPLDNQELRLRFMSPSIVTVQRRTKKEEIKFEPGEPTPTKSVEAVKKARKKVTQKAVDTKKKVLDAKNKELAAAEKRAMEAEKRAKDAEDLARQQQTEIARQEAERLKYEAAQATQAVEQKTQEVAAAKTDLNIAININAGATTTAESAGGGVTPTPSSEPSPTPEPGPLPPEEPVAPPPSGGGGGGGILLGLLALVGVGVALSKKKPTGDENPETVYAGR